jgi:hypothetical protein
VCPSKCALQEVHRQVKLAVRQKKKLMNFEHVDEGKFLFAVVDLLQGKVQYW